MSSRIIQKYINVNTKFRPYVKGEQAKSTDFLVSLPNPISNVLSMKLKTFNAPDSEYTIDINLSNNSFEVINRIPTPNTSQLITIPPGNYNTEQMLNTVNAALLMSAGHASFLELLYISLPNGRALNRFAFIPRENYGGTIRDFELNFDVKPNNYIYNTFGWKLGFQKSYYSSKQPIIDLTPAPINLVTPPSIENNIPECPKNVGNIGGLTRTTFTESGVLLPEIALYYLADTPITMPNTSSYYLLALNDFLNQSDLTFHEACYPSNNIMDNIFARVNTKYALDNNTVYEADNSECYKRTYSGPVTLSKLHIKLYDDNNNIAELNNADYSFLLELEVKA
jgi:hypothetical protein